MVDLSVRELSPQLLARRPLLVNLGIQVRLDWVLDTHFEGRGRVLGHTRGDEMGYWIHTTGRNGVPGTHTEDVMRPSRFAPPSPYVEWALTDVIGC